MNDTLLVNGHPMTIVGVAQPGFASDCLDLSAPMRDAARAGRLLYAPEDSHWNADGHAFVADQLLSVWNLLGLDAR